MDELKTSEEWYLELSLPKGLVILDYDGWDRVQFEHSWLIEKITKEEYINRLMNSTCKFKLNKKESDYE